MKKNIGKLSAMVLAVAILASPAGGLLTTQASAMMDKDRPRSSTATTSSASSGFKTSQVYAYSKVKKKIAEYQETNKDVKGWLIIPGTNISEPVLFSNKDNSYYLYRDWRGKHYPNTNYQNFVVTATYADYRTQWGETWKKSSKNTVLYGHNWTNLRDPLAIGNVAKHTMFAQLPSYTNKDFATQHPYIYYSTGENEGIWKVFSVAYTELSINFFYNSPNPSAENYQKLLTEWKARTMYNFDVDVAPTDRILTLSTCTRQYNMGGEQRFVVVARLLRDGEAETDAVKVTINENMKKPQF